MKKYVNLISLPILILSTIMSISSNSMFFIWMTMEMNMMSFIPLLLLKNFFKKNYSIKYFLIQSISSMIMMFSFLMILNIETLNNKLTILIMLILEIMLLTKLGMPPMYTWFPQMMMNISWPNSMILLIWQKITPMFLLSMIMNMNFYKLNLFTLIYLMTTLFMSLFLAINQVSMKLIMCFSSMTNMCWMLMIMMNNEMLWLFYFILYSMISLNLMMNFFLFNLNYLNNFTNMNLNLMNKIIMFLMIFSMMGLPPTMGFLMKWLSIIFMIKYMNFIYIYLFIINSMISMFYYIRMFMKMFILNYFFKNNFKQMNFKLKMNFLTMFNLLFMINLFMFEYF